MVMDFSTIQGSFQALSIVLYILFGALSAIALIAGMRTTF